MTDTKPLIDSLTAEIAERDSEIFRLNEGVADIDRRLAEKDQQCQDHINAVSESWNSERSELQRQIVELNRQLGNT